MLCIFICWRRETEIEIKSSIYSQIWIQCWMFTIVSLLYARTFRQVQKPSSRSCRGLQLFCLNVCLVSSFGSVSVELKPDKSAGSEILTRKTMWIVHEKFIFIQTTIILWILCECWFCCCFCFARVFDQMHSEIMENRHSPTMKYVHKLIHYTTTSHSAINNAGREDL